MGKCKRTNSEGGQGVAAVVQDHMRQARCFAHFVYQTRCVDRSLVINMSQDTVDMLHEVKEDAAFTVKQAKANIFTWKAHKPALYQTKCCKGRRPRVT